MSYQYVEKIDELFLLCWMSWKAGELWPIPVSYFNYEMDFLNAKFYPTVLMTVLNKDHDLIYELE